MEIKKYVLEQVSKFSLVLQIAIATSLWNTLHAQDTSINQFCFPSDAEQKVIEYYDDQLQDMNMGSYKLQTMIYKYIMIVNTREKERLAFYSKELLISFIHEGVSKELPRLYKRYRTDISQLLKNDPYISGMIGAKHGMRFNAAMDVAKKKEIHINLSGGSQ